jgi:hypothetical protein
MFKTKKFSGKTEIESINVFVANLENQSNFVFHPSKTFEENSSPSITSPNSKLFLNKYIKY